MKKYTLCCLVFGLCLLHAPFTHAQGKGQFITQEEPQKWSDPHYMAESTQNTPVPQSTMEENTAIVQAELQKMYSELLAMRGDKNFIENGTSSQNPLAADWKHRVQGLRTWIRMDVTVAMKVKDIPGLMMGLAMDKDWRSGQDSFWTRRDQKEIDEAIHWKFEPQ